MASLLTEVRGAIAVHHTATSDGTWDGAMCKANLPNEADALKAANAWVDPEGDPTAKSSYKFIHHEVSADGTVGAANIKACSSGIGILNGGRGGTNVPADDRRGIYNHLAAHIRDAGGTPPELKSMSAHDERIDREFERRMFEFRAVAQPPEADDTEPMPTLEGYASVFGVRAEIFPGLVEEIAPGAFTKTLKEGDARAFWNHNPDIVLGRRKNGTLQLSQDRKGLHVKINPPDTDLVRDIAVAPIQRGDVDQMSFGFRMIREDWTDLEDGTTLRTILEAQLFEVSPVAIPAYPSTSISARMAQRYAEHRAQLHSSAPAASHAEQSANEAPILPDHAAMRHMRLELAIRGL